MNEQLNSPDFNAIAAPNVGVEMPGINASPEINHNALNIKIGGIALDGFNIQPMKNLANKNTPVSAPAENKFATPLPENISLNTARAEDIAANLAPMQTYKADVAAQAEKIYSSVRLAPLSESNLVVGGFRRKNRRIDKRRPSELKSRFGLVA